MAIPKHKTVLLLEDQALITLYMEELLHQAGFDDITTYSSCTGAAKWLENESPAFAVIETKLRDGACDDIAALLSKRGIPFVVHSVERDQRSAHPEMDVRLCWMEKPCRPEEFIQAVTDCGNFVGPGYSSVSILEA